MLTESKKPLRNQLSDAREHLSELFDGAKKFLDGHEDEKSLRKMMETPVLMLTDSDWNEYEHWDDIERGIKNLMRIEREMLAEMKSGKL